MRIATIVARILFGLVFTAAGLSGFIFLFTSWPPTSPGVAGELQAIWYKSHMVVFVSAVQLITGVLLLSNRYVPVALMASAAVLANILAFHILLMPLGIFPGLILCGCWIVVARSRYSELRGVLSP